MVDEFWERANTKLNMQQKQSSLSLYEKNNKFGYISSYNGIAHTIWATIYSLNLLAPNFWPYYITTWIYLIKILPVYFYIQF